MIKPESTAEWVAHILKKSSVMERYLRAMDPEDYFHRKDRLGNLLTENESNKEWNLSNLPLPSGLLLTGPRGCGKHTALIFALEFLSRDTYGRTVFLTGNDLASTQDSAEAVIERLETLWQDSCEQHFGLCFVFEQLEHFPYAQELFSFLENLHLETMLDEAGLLPPVFYIFLSEKPLPVHALMRSDLFEYRLPLPDSEMRGIYFQKLIEQQKCGDFFNDERIRLLIDGTEGETLCRLSEIFSHLLLMIDIAENQELTDEQFLSCIAEQSIQATSFSPSPRMRQWEAFFERITDKLASLPVQAVQAVPPASSAVSAENNDSADDMKSADPMKAKFDAKIQNLQNESTGEQIANWFSDDSDAELLTQINSALENANQQTE